MKCVDTIARIRREYFVRGKSIKEIVRDLHVSRNTVRKVVRSGVTVLEYERTVQPMPKLGPWKADLDRLLGENSSKPVRERLTLIRIFEELRGLGYDGGYDAVRRYARTWQREQASLSAAAFVPLSFDPGEAYQFDWSHEVVLINGTTVTVKVAHVRLCHSRMLFVRAYPRESQEMVFDAHDRAFAFFKGACTRGIYDNMKTAVETIFVGRERAYNRRFLQMCGHYLVDPVACTPASGWEKGQVENQVGLVRERFFTPRLRVKSYEELNAWLLDRCVAFAKAHPHPQIRDRTVWDVFEEERPKLVSYRGRFDGFHAVPVAVSKTCLVRFDNNRYYEAGLQWLRLAAAGVFDELPDLQIVLGHWGEVVLFYLERTSAAFERALNLNRSLEDYARRNLYVTGSGIWSEAYLRRCLDLVGPERLLFSTDFPYQYRPGGGPRRFLEEISLDDRTRQGLAHGNWDRLTQTVVSGSGSR